MDGFVGGTAWADPGDLVRTDEPRPPVVVEAGGRLLVTAVGRL